MFDNLSEGLTRLVKNLSGQGRLTEANIKDSLKSVRKELLAADVALEVVQDFIAQVQAEAVGMQVATHLNPGQELIKLVHKHLVSLMGEENAGLNLQTQPPAVMLMAGLQGSGKTTTTAKLARWLKQEAKKSVMVVSVDVYRPAAIEQLKTLAEQIDVAFFPSAVGEKPEAIVKAAVAQAKKQFIDVLLVDTAGRLHIDEEMMDEVRRVHRVADPIETLFVVDSMTGQDAARTAKAFHEALPLTGVVLTKTDGDARGGAALSMRHITGKPIKFMGEGEKVDALALFHPERVASRILGMGDVLTLIEDVERHVDEKKAKKLAKKITKGKGFDLEDFREQLIQMKKMGGVAGLMDKLPMMGGKLPAGAAAQLDDKQFVRMEAMINSMTHQERHFPALIKASRKRRIANGSGTQVQDVNRLLKQFTQMQKMMKRMSRKGNMARLMGQMKDMM